VPIPLRAASRLAWTLGANPHGDLLLRRGGSHGQGKAADRRSHRASRPGRGPAGDAGQVPLRAEDGGVVRPQDPAGGPAQAGRAAVPSAVYVRAAATARGHPPVLAGLRRA
jgi:hypothetical protein